MASWKHTRDPDRARMMDARPPAARCGRPRCGVCHPDKKWPRPRNHRRAVELDWVDLHPTR